MPLREEGDAFAHQLGEQPALVVGEDGVGDLRQDHLVTVGRRALEDEDQDGDPGQDRDAADILVDIGLVDDLAEQIGRAGGGRRRDRHQRERQQIAAPVGGALFHDQAANQDRRAIGVVGDFLRKFGHPRSIDGARQDRPRVRPKRNASLPAISGFFKPNEDLRRMRIQADAACGTSPWRSRNNFSSQASACAAMVSRSSYCGVQSSVARMRLVSAIMVMISPGRRGPY